MYSYNFPIPHHDMLFFVDLFETYADVFRPSVDPDENVRFINEYSDVINSKRFKGTTCVYMYYHYNEPLYVGCTTDGDKYRFKKQLRAVFDKEYNRKSPEKPLMKGNIRETFVYKLHLQNLDVRGITLKVLSLENNVIGDDSYERVCDLIESYGLSVFEQMLMNNLNMRGEDSKLLNASKPSNMKKLTRKSKSNSTILKHINARANTTVEEFLA